MGPVAMIIFSLMAGLFIGDEGSEVSLHDERKGGLLETVHGRVSPPTMNRECVSELYYEDVGTKVCDTDCCKR